MFVCPKYMGEQQESNLLRAGPLVSFQYTLGFFLFSTVIGYST